MFTLRGTDVEEALQFRSRHGSAVQITLRFVAALAYEIVELRLSFHTFGDGRHLKGVCEIDDRRDERTAFGVIG